MSITVPMVSQWVQSTWTTIYHPTASTPLPDGMNHQCYKLVCISILRLIVSPHESPPMTFPSSKWSATKIIQLTSITNHSRGTRPTILPSYATSTNYTLRNYIKWVLSLLGSEHYPPSYLYYTSQYKQKSKLQ